jgi:hypothetical protein
VYTEVRHGDSLPLIPNLLHTITLRLTPLGVIFTILASACLYERGGIYILLPMIDDNKDDNDDNCQQRRNRVGSEPR